MSAELRRLVVCLDVDGGRVKKGVRFEGLRDVGDPVELAVHYEEQGADEIVFLDVGASHEDRPLTFDCVRRTAERLFVPLTVGGGIRTVDDMAEALAVGADKVAVNSSAVARPELLGEGGVEFGAQCVVCSIDAKRDEAMPSGYRVVTHGGRRATELDAIAWAQRAAALGAGEILLTSIDRDGMRQGYDLELTRAVAEAVAVPVVASGGAGSAAHVVEVLQGPADAALIAGIVHDRVTTVPEIKRASRAAGIAMREAGR